MPRKNARPFRGGGIITIKMTKQKSKCPLGPGNFSANDMQLTKSRGHRSRGQNTQFMAKLCRKKISKKRDSWAKLTSHFSPKWHKYTQFFGQINKGSYFQMLPIFSIPPTFWFFVAKKSPRGLKISQQLSLLAWKVPKKSPRCLKITQKNSQGPENYPKKFPKGLKIPKKPLKT